MVHELEHPVATPRKLTRSVLQITTMPEMHQAGLARVVEYVSQIVLQ